MPLSGEFMQLGSKENENERFKHYLEKTFKKTASLIANSCKAVCTFCLHKYPRAAGSTPFIRRTPFVTELFFLLRFQFWSILTLTFMK